MDEEPFIILALINNYFFIKTLINTSYLSYRLYNPCFI
jgi:hypothetical protein